MVGREEVPEEVPDGPDSWMAVQDAQGGGRRPAGSRAVESLDAAHAALATRVDLCRLELDAVAGALSGGAVAAARLELSCLTRSLDAAQARAAALERENERLRAALHAASSANESIAREAAVLAGERDGLAADLAHMRASAAGPRPALPRERGLGAALPDEAAEPACGGGANDQRGMTSRLGNGSLAIPEDRSSQDTVPLSPGQTGTPAPPQAAVRGGSQRQDSGSETVGPPLEQHVEGSSQTLSAAEAPQGEGRQEAKALPDCDQARLCSPEDETQLDQPGVTGVREPRLHSCAEQEKGQRAEEAQDGDGAGGAAGGGTGRWMKRTSPNSKARMRQSRIGLRRRVGPKRLGIVPRRSLQASTKALKHRSSKDEPSVVVGQGEGAHCGATERESAERPQGDRQRCSGAPAGGIEKVVGSQGPPLEGSRLISHRQKAWDQERREGGRDTSAAGAPGASRGETQASTSKSRVLAWLQDNGSSQPEREAEDNVRKALQYGRETESDDECTVLENNQPVALAQRHSTKWRCTKKRARPDELECDSEKDDFLETPRQRAAENGNGGAHAAQRTKSGAKGVRVLVDAEADLLGADRAGQRLIREQLSAGTKCKGKVQCRDAVDSRGPLSALAHAEEVKSRPTLNAGVQEPCQGEQADDGLDSAKHQAAAERAERDRRGAGVPAYKYKDVVRRKDEREGLAAGDCVECRKFYDAIMAEDPGGLLAPRCDHHQAASRHRYRFAPPSTPSGFWNIGFDSSM